MIKLFKKFSLLSFVLGVVAAFFFFADFSQIARAISPNYAKTVGGQLTTTDWNNLPTDFVHRSGGPASSMTGALNMGNQRITNLAAPTADTDAATRRYVMDTAGSLSRDTSGNPLKMVCGRTLNTQWFTDPEPNTIGVNVNLTPYAFSSTPNVYTSMGGTNYHFKAIGAANIYFASTSGFSVFVTHLDQTITTGNAATWNWYINWCAIGRP